MRLLSFIVLGCIITVFFAGCSEPEDYYTIGIPDLPSFRPAAELAVEQINGSGGIRGRKLQVVSAPYRAELASYESAVEMADFLVKDERVLGVVGHISSADSLPAAHIYEKESLVNIVPSSTHPLLTTIGPHIFRLCSNDSYQGKYLAEFAAETLEVKSVAVFFQNSNYGKNLSRVFIKSISNLGVEVCYVGWFGLQSQLEFDDVLDSIESRKCDLLFFAGNPPSSRQLLGLLEERNSGLIYLTGDSCFQVRLAAQRPEDSVNVRWISSTFYYPNSDSGQASDFIAAFRERFDRDPEAVNALVYDAIQLMAAGIRDGGTTRSRLTEEISAGRPFHGVSGTIIMSPSGECIRPFYIVEMTQSMRLIDSIVIDSTASPGDVP